MDILQRVDEEHRAVIESMPDILDMTDVPALRDAISAFMSAHPPSPRDGVRQGETLIPAQGGQPSVKVLTFSPANLNGETRPALLWIHGGGTVYGQPEHDIDLCAHLCAEAQCDVFAVTYRLAPENPYPAGLNDCLHAYNWLHGFAETLGIDTQRIVVGGASAGAGIAVGTCLMIRDLGFPAPCGQLLLYPMLDPREASWISRPIDHHGVWHRAANRAAWAHYLSGRESPPIYAAPALCKDHNNLPAAAIIVGDNDLFLDEDMAYARALQRAGVVVDLHVVPGAFHASELFLPKHPTSVMLTSLRDECLKAHFQKPVSKVRYRSGIS